MKNLKTFIAVLGIALVFAVFGDVRTAFAGNYEIVAENDEAILYVDKKISSFRVEMKGSGAFYDTKIMDGQTGNASIRNNQKSDLTINYLTDRIRRTSGSMDNYTQSIQLNQVGYEPIENGVRVNFLMGDANKLQLSMFPYYMSFERMEELILPNLTPEEEFKLLDQYYYKGAEYYGRRDSPTTTVTALKLRSYNDFFYVKSGYTFEDLEFDNDMFGQETIDTNMTFNIFVEYTLDGRDLVVRVPWGDTMINVREERLKDIVIHTLTLNPYIMASRADDEGYLFVPDGSGAIINFNNGKTASTAFTIPFYGSDPLNVPFFYKEAFTLEKALLPVYGMKRNDTALLAIVEKGAGGASISSQVSGKIDDFNSTIISFNTFYYELMPIMGAVVRYIPKYQQGRFEGDIQMRYKLLEGEDADYVGMAKAYRDYLEERGQIKNNPVPEDAPMTVEYLGMLPTFRNFFGFDITAYDTLTSFDQAQEITNKLLNTGVKNITLQYTSWLKFGIYHEPLKGNLNVPSAVGGKKGLSSFLNYAKSKNIDAYSTVNLIRMRDTSGISLNEATPRYINSQKAYQIEFFFVNKTIDGMSWIVSPNYMPKYFKNAAESLGKLGVENIAVADAGWYLYGDYNKRRQILRQEAPEIYRENLDKLAETHKLMYSNVSDYALSSASYVTDMPTGYSNRRLVDYGIPFTQLVMENYIPYSMSSYNNDSTQGIDKYLMKAIETKSNLKFTLTYADETKYSLDTGDFGKYFQTRYDRWEELIGTYYTKYNDFYQKVKNAEVKIHQQLTDNLIKVVYTNGVTVYLNYGRDVENTDGLTIQPMSYVITD